MAKTALSICNRCGVIYDPDQKEWFKNKFGDWCHFCPDSVIGGVGEWCKGELRPTIISDILDTGSFCPVCGLVLQMRPDGNEIYLHNADDMFPNLAWKVCLQCLIASPLDSARPEMPWYLLEFEKYAPTNTEDDPDAAIVRHFEWIKSSTGIRFKPSEVSRAFGLNQNSMDRVVGNNGDYKHKRSPLAIPCGSCGTKMDPIIHDVEDRMQLNMRSTVEITGMEVAFELRCTVCSREDYYLYNKRLNKWTWCGFDKPDIDRLKPAALGADIQDQDMEKLAELRPVEPGASTNSSSSSSLQSKEEEETNAASLADQLKELLGG